MKKLYSKPEIIIESFEISEFIAGNCDIDVGFGDVGSIKICTYKDPAFGGALTLFNSQGICDMIWEEGNDQGCYNIPMDGNRYFGS